MDGNMVSVGIALGGIVIWAIRLEGRINVQDALQRELKEDVEYIRARIDKALNGRP